MRHIEPKLGPVWKDITPESNWVPLPILLSFSSAAPLFLFLLLLLLLPLFFSSSPVGLLCGRVVNSQRSPRIPVSFYCRPSSAVQTHSLPATDALPMDSTLLEHPRSPSFMDAPPFPYDSLTGLDYLQYPQSPFGVSSMTLPGPSTSSPRLDFDTLNLTNSLGEYSYSSTSSYTTASPGRPYTPQDNGISPPAVYNLSAGELSSDGLASGRRSRGGGTHSPSSVHSVPYAAVPRSHRFNPIAAPPATRSAKVTRRKSRNEDSDDEDDDFQPAPSTVSTTDARRETIRRQRIESEQRRRDELRDGYRRLKDALPVSNQKSSKVSLLDRATTHVKYLEMTAQQLQGRLQQAENEVQRLRTVNEALMLGTAEQRHAAAAAVAAVSQPPPTF